MLHRLGVASTFAVTASLLSGIAAIAITTGPTVITALPARAAAAASNGHPATNGVTQPVPATSSPAPSTPQQPGSGPRPVFKPPTTPPTATPSAGPPPYNCAGSDDGMTEAYKHAREQYCQGGGD